MKIAEFLTVNVTSLKSMAISHQLQEDRVYFFFTLSCTFKFLEIVHMLYLFCVLKLPSLFVMYVSLQNLNNVHNMMDMLSHAFSLYKQPNKRGRIYQNMLIDNCSMVSSLLKLHISGWTSLVSDQMVFSCATLRGINNPCGRRAAD